MLPTELPLSPDTALWSHMRLPAFLFPVFIFRKHLLASWLPFFQAQYSSKVPAVASETEVTSIENPELSKVLL